MKETGLKIGQKIGDTDNCYNCKYDVRVYPHRDRCGLVDRPKPNFKWCDDYQPTLYRRIDLAIQRIRGKMNKLNKAEEERFDDLWGVAIPNRKVVKEFLANALSRQRKEIVEEAGKTLASYLWHNGCSNGEAEKVREKFVKSMVKQLKQ